MANTFLYYGTGQVPKSEKKTNKQAENPANMEKNWKEVKALKTIDRLGKRPFRNINKIKKKKQGITVRQSSYYFFKGCLRYHVSNRSLPDNKQNDDIYND